MHYCDLESRRIIIQYMMLTRRRQVFVAPLMWIFHSQVYTNTYAFMAITEALSAVGGKSLFLAFVEIKGHHHLLKQKKEEMNAKSRSRRRCQRSMSAEEEQVTMPTRSLHVARPQPGYWQIEEWQGQREAAQLG